MNKEKQRIAIAKACQYIRQSPISLWFDHPTEDQVHEADLPDYLNDLNAMHEAEKTLDAHQRHHYINILDGMMDDSDPVQHDFQWCCATAEQRREAILRAIGRWEEEE